MLVGTEMLAYGIDIQGASHVVNVDIPTSVSSYVHRAGRVGRVGGTRGVVVSLPRDETELNQLQSYADELGFTLEVMDKPPPPAPPVQPKHHLRRQMYHELRSWAWTPASSTTAMATTTTTITHRWIPAALP